MPAREFAMSKTIEVRTADGMMPVFVCHPDGGGPWPAVIMYMDAPGIRDELKTMAKRLSDGGYYVLLPQLYHRSREDIAIDSTQLHHDGPDRKRMMSLIDSIGVETVMTDTSALLDYIDATPQIRKDLIGCVGYCMSGPYVIAAAERFPQRFKAAASFFGTHMVTGEADSPHSKLDRIKANLHVGFGEKDRFSPPELIETFRRALADSSASGDVEVYAGADHAFAFPMRSTYHPAAAELHWKRMLDLGRCDEPDSCRRSAGRRIDRRRSAACCIASEFSRFCGAYRRRSSATL
jgi:carboxymethylenebutenolidase